MENKDKIYYMYFGKLPQGVSFYKVNYSKYPFLFIFFVLIVIVKDDNILFYLITNACYYTNQQVSNNGF